MPKVSPTVNTFNSGEFSPNLLGRFDISKYSNAAKTLKNVLLHQAGGANRRPGTKFVQEVKDSSVKTRIITFEFSTTQTYILEFSDLLIRFYRNQGIIEDSGSPVELVTPYLEADLFDLQFAQDADTMWIVHPDYEPRNLTRSAHITWTLTAYAPTADPFGSDGADTNPSCVAMFEQRIVFANSNDDPQKIWASKSGDFENMTVGTNAGDGFVYVIASDKVNAIRWLKPVGKSLQMGTLGSTFSMSSGADALAVTPTNVSIKRDTTYGAANILPEVIGNFIYYVQRDLNHLRELGFSFDIDAQQALDMTLLSDHIAKAEDPLDSDGFTQIAYQQSPVSRLWCVRNDGQLAVLTRQIDQEVIGWSREVSGRDSRDNGVYESVAIIPTDGGDDEVWVVVKRFINGATVRYVEFFMPEEFDAQQDAFFVDSGLSLDSPITITDIAAKTILDDMEYSSDSAAQSAFVSSDTSIDSETKMLLHLNGTNGSTVFTDAAGNHTPVAVGDAKLDTSVKKFGTASLGLLTAGSYVTVPDSDDWHFGSGDFTIDIWLRPDTLAADTGIIGQFVDADNFWGLELEGVGGPRLNFLHKDSGTIRLNITDAHGMSVGQQFHIEITRSGDVFTIRVDGVEIVNTTNTVAMANLAAPLEIGRFRGGTSGSTLDGHYDEVRVSKAIARWRADHDVPVVEHGPPLQVYSETTIKQQGSFSIRSLAVRSNSLNDTLTRTISSTIDLSGINSIKLDVYALRTGTNLRVSIHDSGGTTSTKDIVITASNTWETITWDISAIADGDKDAIDSIIFTILNADDDNIFYVDNMFAVTGSVTVTAASHGFSTSDQVRIVDVKGMTEVNDMDFLITKVNDNSFTLQDLAGDNIDGTAFNAYISGGEARKMVTAITGLTHLVGETVAITADGLSVAVKIVSGSGGITLDEKASVVHAGLPYVTDIELLPQPEGSATGTAVGKVQKIVKILVKFFESLGVQYGPDEDNLDTLSETTLFTGDRDLPFPSDWDREGAVLLRQAEPLPLNILSVTLISDVVDD